VGIAVATVHYSPSIAVDTTIINYRAEYIAAYKCPFCTSISKIKLNMNNLLTIKILLHAHDT
jgi:hypothetical protein